MSSWDYTNTGSPTDPLQTYSIECTPDPPAPGKDLKVVIKAAVTDEIAQGAYADVVVKLGLVKLLQKRFDLFEELRNRPEWSLTADSGGGAPLRKGDVVITFDGRLPREIPRAKFTIDVRAYTADEEDLAAVKLNVAFLPSLPN